MYNLNHDETYKESNILACYIHCYLYITVSQNPQIAQSDTFNQFLLNAQKESQKAAPEKVVFHVYLMNGHQITVDIMSTDQTDAVLEVRGWMYAERMTEQLRHWIWD